MQNSVKLRFATQFDVSVTKNKQLLSQIEKLFPQVWNQKLTRNSFSNREFEKIEQNYKSGTN